MDLTMTIHHGFPCSRTPIFLLETWAPWDPNSLGSAARALPSPESCLPPSMGGSSGQKPCHSAFSSSHPLTVPLWVSLLAPYEH